MYETSIFPKSISSKTPVQDKNDFTNFNHNKLISFIYFPTPLHYD